MSLPLSFSSFNIENENNVCDSSNEQSSYMAKKKQNRKINRTQKNKLKSAEDLDVLAQFGLKEGMSELEAMDSEDSNLSSYSATFNPPPMAKSSKNELEDKNNQDDQDDQDDQNDQNDQKRSREINNNKSDDPPLLSQQKYNQLQNEYAKQYYSNYVPNSGYTSNLGGISGENRDDLVKKVNYLIHLLEEHKDEKTHHVTEEVILYMFLGVFLIFVIDSFSKTAKYTRK